MKNPFASSAHLALALHNLAEMRELHRKDVEYLRALLQQERDAHATTREQMHALRVAGGNPSVPMPVPEFDRVRDAIIERSGGNVRLERHLMREAAKLRLRNKTDDEIIEAVTNWRDPSAEEASG